MSWHPTPICCIKVDAALRLKHLETHALEFWKVNTKFVPGSNIIFLQTSIEISLQILSKVVKFKYLLKCYSIQTEKRL